MSKARKPSAAGFRVPALVRNNAAYRSRVENAIPAAILNCIVTTALADGIAPPTMTVAYTPAMRDLIAAVDDHFRGLPWPTRRLLIDAVDDVVAYAVTKNGVSMSPRSLVLACLYWLSPIAQNADRQRAVMNPAFLRAFPALLADAQGANDYVQCSEEAGWIAEIIRVRLESLGLFVGAAQPVGVAA
ncbi:hypothetical protein D9623_33775 (plasmid) [Azospirillum brasilense]|uniref:Uncharacterized protein n=1 Tax=Azospirillum brasilense TaxID=192 RepID=Q6QW49_AZOBR|nr:MULTISPECIES: hypothetical protein [Azospirillum]YP_001686853.1 hypothetical protein APCd_gp12 [Azospirillum phage Cd]AAS83071.1 hypothetical protein pRhico083 [Azospirillum brasilense]MDW7555410.1 hypothetical protein [Azospirillum brasilense]MDW7595182.1 hypothetical protein [Azospirillum brasilense]MDW7630335.1 hypothetical protein [Azospirillum brasilense]MDX5949703.1 hypothetical protein [Azospirillum brasilense]